MTQARESDLGKSGESEYELSLAGEGIEIKRRVPQSVALRVIALVMGSGVSAAPSLNRDVRPRTPTGVTLGEFLHETNATRNPDKILAVAVYWIRHLGHSGVTKEELKSQFQVAGHALPANFARDFAWTVSNRWLAPSHDNPGEFFVTSTGINAVDEGFGAEVRKASKLRARGRKRVSRRPAG